MKRTRSRALAHTRLSHTRKPAHARRFSRAGFPHRMGHAPQCRCCRGAMSPRCETTCSRAQSRCQARNDGILAQHVMGELNRHCDGCCPCPRSPVAEKGAVTTSASGGDRGTRKKLAVSKEAAGSASQPLAGSGKRWRSRPKNLAHSLASSRGRAAARKLAVCMAAAIALSLRASGAEPEDTFSKADRHGMPFPPKDGWSGRMVSSCRPLYGPS